MWRTLGQRSRKRLRAASGVRVDILDYVTLVDAVNSAVYPFNNGTCQTLLLRLGSFTELLDGVVITPATLVQRSWRPSHLTREGDALYLATLVRCLRTW